MKTLGHVLDIVLSATALCAFYLTAPGEVFEFDKAEMTIVNTEGASHDLVLEVATSKKQRALGLMFREQMSEGAGMIFIFPSTRPARMWMKNMALELDMLFVDEDGVVREIRPHVHPHSDLIVSSRNPVRYVIELNGGASTSLGIRPGSRLILAMSSSENKLLPWSTLP